MTGTSISRPVVSARSRTHSSPRSSRSPLTRAPAGSLSRTREPSAPPRRSASVTNARSRRVRSATSSSSSRRRFGRQLPLEVREEPLPAHVHTLGGHLVARRPWAVLWSNACKLHQTHQTRLTCCCRLPGRRGRLVVAWLWHIPSRSRRRGRGSRPAPTRFSCHSSPRWRCSCIPGWARGVVELLAGSPGASAGGPGHHHRRDPGAGTAHARPAARGGGRRRAGHGALRRRASASSPLRPRRPRPGARPPRTRGGCSLRRHRIRRARRRPTTRASVHHSRRPRQPRSPRLTRAGSPRPRRCGRSPTSAC